MLYVLAFIVGIIVGYFLLPRKAKGINKNIDLQCKHQELQEITCFGDESRRFKCKICGEIFERSE